jgi:hypothetical protein
MYAKFKIKGQITRSAVKESKRIPGNMYGQIEVACGRAAHDFFVPAEDIENGRWPIGATVEAQGDIGRNGFNPSLDTEELKVVGKPDLATAGK